MEIKGIRKAYDSIQDYVMIVLGTILYGFGFNGFILSNEIVIGGLTGLSTLIYFATNIPVSVSYLVINIVLLVVAFKILGFNFLIKTIFGVLCLSASLYSFEWLLGGVPIIEGEPFMSIILGGAICGTGLGLIFSVNGSTGGTDILAAIVNKYRNLSIGTGLFIFDFFIISSSWFIFGNVQKIVFGFVEMLINNYVLDQIVNGNRQSVQFLIFSRKHEEITERIIKDLDRGCTLLNGEGGYSKESAKVIVLLAKKSESLTIFRIVKEIDPQAFISQSLVKGVYGEGFDQIKA